MRLDAMAAVLLWGLAGCAPDLNWREVRIDEAGLMQMFPCRPHRQQRTVMLGARPRPVTLYVCDADQASWALAVADVDEPAARDKVLQAMADTARANLGIVGSAAPETLRGERYRLRGKTPDGRALELAGRVEARGNHVLQWAVVGANPRAGEIDAFLSSALVTR